MRIILIGTVDFSLHCLVELMNNGGNVVAVLTLARERAKFNSDYADLSDVAAQNRIPVYKIRKTNNPQTVELIKSLEPDVIFVFGWSQLISAEILSIPPMGCIGTHPALLPKNRGRHPIIWALVEGLRESGLTFFYLDEGADDGDILWQKPFPITLEDDACSLYEKIKTLASEAIREFLPQLECGNTPRIPQDHTKATYWRKRSEEDGEIDWAAPTVEIYNLVRALTRPYVGAHTFSGDQKIQVWRAMLPEQSLPSDLWRTPSGTVMKIAVSGFEVRTGDGYLTVSNYESSEEASIEVGRRLGAGH